MSNDTPNKYQINTLVGANIQGVNSSGERRNIITDDDGNLQTGSANDPLEGYHISDQETDTTSYFGYLNRDGAWYIQKGIRTASVTNYTYAKGTSGYDWSNRASESYASFDTTF